MKSGILMLCLGGLYGLLTGCEDPWFAEKDCIITIENRSSKDVGFALSYQYPDTTLPASPAGLGFAASGNVYSLSSEKKWEKVFEEDVPSDTLCLFVFEGYANTENYNKVRANNSVLKRYNLSLQDLQQRNWVVVYP